MNDIKNENTESVDIDEFDEFDEAEKEAAASGDVYVLKFKTPFEFEGKVYEEITFDFGGLTGKDFIAIENEMQSEGKILISPKYSGEFLMLMAARAAPPQIASDAFVYMSLGDYHRIRSAARAFLLRAEVGPKREQRAQRTE